METKIEVPEIHCGHCKMSIEGAVAALQGVEAVEVDVPGRTVSVRYRSEVVDIDSIISAIEEQGYEVPRG